MHKVAPVETLDLPTETPETLEPWTGKVLAPASMCINYINWIWITYIIGYLTTNLINFNFIYIIIQYYCQIAWATSMGEHQGSVCVAIGW